MNYPQEAAALDEEIAAMIATRSVPDFDRLALRIFAHQLRYNAPYARYCAALGVGLNRMPERWEEIPPVPAAAFKELTLCTFDSREAALVFETSGTTSGSAGKHYMENARLYDASLSAGFQEGFLHRRSARLRYLLLVPNPQQNPSSSLGYMMQRVAREFGDGHEAWYLDESVLDVRQFVHDLRGAAAGCVPVCIAATAFALVNFLDAALDRGIEQLELPAGSQLMETGGFKGRSRSIERNELYAQLSEFFSIPESAIVAEYGMTELSSQYYDREDRVKVGPPWLRARVAGQDGRTLPQGKAGTLVHTDLANRSSCVSVLTQDAGIAVEGGFILLGRERDAEVRGCSLELEALTVLH